MSALFIIVLQLELFVFTVQTFEHIIFRFLKLLSFTNFFFSISANFSFSFVLLKHSHPQFFKCCFFLGYNNKCVLYTDGVTNAVVMLEGERERIMVAYDACLHVLVASKLTNAICFVYGCH